MDNTIKNVKEWIKEICPGETGYENHVKVISDFGEGDVKDGIGEWKWKFRFKVYTKQNTYTIVALKESGNSDGYLGCVVSSRTFLPGEEHTRGRDLPDGALCRETWEEIKDAIIAYELVPLSKYTLKHLNDTKEVEDNNATIN